jgi:dTDP-4-dehydrorhamnose 3,5-epimerase
MSTFTISPSRLAGLNILERAIVADARGSFRRLFCARELADVFGGSGPVQVNQSFTAAAGSIRGMHFQHPPHAETKLVTCVAGAVFDVAIDLRRESSTFLDWFGIRLDAENGRSLLIPSGFAHGFQTLTEDSLMIYAHSAFYEAAHEGAINPLDPAISIGWPVPVSSMSVRDKSHPLIDGDFAGVLL